MMGETGLAQLRDLLEGVAGPFVTGHTHKFIDDACQRLALPVLSAADGLSKRERFERSFAALPDEDLPAVAARVLKLQVNAATRNKIQDLLWVSSSTLEVQKRTRHEIARDLDLDDFAQQGDRFWALLDRLWVLDDDPFSDPFSFFTGSQASLRSRVDRHVFCNPGDWSAADLFEQLGAFEASHPRFVRFLEGLVSADLIPDEPTQRRLTEVINTRLRTDATELRETGTEGGYPVFSVVSTRSPQARRPRTLIFATRSKPDLRLRDVLDNDLEVLNDQDNVLVYDRPIGVDGIRWRDLQTWWKETRRLIDDTEAKKGLYDRLRDCLPKNSPPQRMLYKLYHDIHGTAVPDLPALIPEVWLHWDPKTVRNRGPQALPRFRMDFLLLLPRGRRVVLEVDGQHHFSTNGRPDDAVYAANMRADRDLKLNGYEVFRFGADELRDLESARPMLQQFFADLFREFDVMPDTDSAD